MGKYGQLDPDQRVAFEERFKRNANKTPRETMRELRLEDGLRDIPLKQAQYIKRRVLAEKFKTAKVGDLVSLVDADSEMPRDTHKGWWCHTDLSELRMELLTHLALVLVTTDNGTRRNE